MEKTHSDFNRVDVFAASKRKEMCVFVPGSLETDWNFYFSNIDDSIREIIELLMINRRTKNVEHAPKNFAEKIVKSCEKSQIVYDYLLYERE